jgi:hypothetical protein
MARLTVGPARISYAYLFEPRPATTPGAKAKYGVTILIPKTATATKAALDKALNETKEQYKAANPKATWINNAAATVYDGDGHKKTGDEFGPECKGHWVINTSSQKQPMIVDQAKQPIFNQEDVYSGCFGLCVINFYCYDTAGNKGIACAIDGFMKTADGPRLGGFQITDDNWNAAADDLAKLNELMA